MINSIDLSYEIQGDSLPLAYAVPLWEALGAHWPVLIANPSLVGILPLRGAEQNQRLWLPRRARLVLRIPEDWSEDAHTLVGQHLKQAEFSLHIGPMTRKPLVAFPSLQSRGLMGPGDEASFTAWVRDQLDQRHIQGEILCGRSHPLSEPNVCLRSLVIHHLSADDSLRLQRIGLGTQHHLGRGLFIPCKTIPNFH